MRVIIQRVTRASVSVGGEVVSSIGKGLLCLVGIGAGDTAAVDGAYLARKIVNARLWPKSGAADAPAWSKSAKQNGYQVLLVSQFTLHGFLKGNKPDYHLSMPPAAARDLFAEFVALVEGEMYGWTRDKGGKKIAKPAPSDPSQRQVLEGVFGAMMAVELVNDGPVTLQLDTEVTGPRAGGKSGGGGGGGGKAAGAGKAGAGTATAAAAAAAAAPPASPAAPALPKAAKARAKRLKKLAKQAAYAADLRAKLAAGEVARAGLNPHQAAAADRADALAADLAALRVECAADVAAAAAAAAAPPAAAGASAGGGLGSGLQQQSANA